MDQMDSNTPNVERAGRAPPSVISALVSAVLEWLLIFMVFIDATFSYLVTRFSHYCRLQIPCLLCSRLDHVFGNETAGFVWELICQKHKSKISSLMFCQLHNKLIDVRETCESCFFSFATINKSNAETYRLLVGKSGPDPHYGLYEGDSLKELDLDSSGTRRCSCCNEQRTSRTYAQRIFQSKPVDSSGYDNRDDVQDISEIPYQLDHLKNGKVDPLSHIGFHKVNVTSDAESDSPLSDNESAGVLISEMATQDKDSADEKLIDTAPPDIDLILKSEDNTAKYFSGVDSEALLRHGLEELKWQSADQNNDISASSHLNSVNEAHWSSDLSEKKETNVTSTDILEKEVDIDYREAPEQAGDSRSSAELSKEILYCRGKPGIKSDSISASESDIDSKPSKLDSSSQVAEFLDLGDAYKLAVGTRGRQQSGKFLECQRSTAGSTRASEDLKLLLSQISVIRGMESSFNDISPRISSNSDDSKGIEASGLQILQKRISLERNESNLSLEGSTISEIEGESEVDRLKRQVDHDKKVMSALYKELEEERNASAVAVNQAMAMITRLQEEKASLRMEALQFLRMMEEQAEYDGEALQEANDMLNEKDKLIQDIEAELQLYRDQLGSEMNIQNLKEKSGESNIDQITTGNANSS